ncbi:MAG: N-formylglutamate amidohydrolase [Myxococcales bacterium]|nr:N-formylglutamate amidohydrolase [Myxococcales bacterium]MDH5308111.1 N-formylglutamate amidohydrolase [Myxococcales bacterium]
MKLVLSCEHAGHRIPRRYAAPFAGCERVVAGHRGWDAGALWLARRLAREFGAPLHAMPLTRLLVDANRSLHHPQLFSKYSLRLPATERSALIERVYRPHREAIESGLAALVRTAEPVLHVAVHSFTPRWKGRARRCDVGLLYDPRRAGERRLCERWQQLLRAREPELRVRRNHPYRGVADGLTTHLRRRFPARSYLGVELELSQARVARSSPQRLRLARLLAGSLRELLGSS